MNNLYSERERKAAQDLADAVNDYSWNGDEFVKELCRQHRTLQANIFRTLVKLILFMGSYEYGYDKRNEACHKIAKDLCQAESMQNPHIPFI